jgi:tetratricopeptide (TPR) repeat protein
VALERSPGHPFTLSNLAYAYRGLGRFAEAKATAEQAVALGVETVPTRRLLYQLAVLDGDAEAAARHVAWAKGKTREFDLISAQAQVAAHGGRIREATELYRVSIDLAARRGLTEAASAYRAHLALASALYGYHDAARTLARLALAPQTQGGESHATAIPLFRAAVTLSLLDAPEALPVLRSADERYPQSTSVQEILLPSARAAAELARGRVAAALEHLRAAASYETGTVAALLPVYLRGQAYLARRSGAEALEQFQRILDHRGSDPFSPVCALAPLGIARAWAVLGDHDRSARAYAEFLASWRHADAEIPVLVAARREAGRLGDTSH